MVRGEKRGGNQPYQVDPVYRNACFAAAGGHCFYAMDTDAAGQVFLLHQRMGSMDIDGILPAPMGLSQNQGEAMPCW